MRFEISWCSASRGVFAASTIVDEGVSFVAGVYDLCLAASATDAHGLCPAASATLRGPCLGLVGWPVQLARALGLVFAATRARTTLTLQNSIGVAAATLRLTRVCTILPRESHANTCRIESFAEAHLFHRDFRVLERFSDGRSFRRAACVVGRYSRRYRWRGVNEHHARA